jgi:cell division septation protein DedD
MMAIPRGANRLKPRVEVTLDGRRVALIVLGEFILLGGAFAGGYLAGGGKEPLVVTAPAPFDFADPLAALDRDAPRVDYTFHRELVAPRSPQSSSLSASRPAAEVPSPRVNAERPRPEAAAPRPPARDLEEVRSLERQVRSLIATSAQASVRSRTGETSNSLSRTDEELRHAMEGSTSRAVVELSHPAPKDKARAEREERPEPKAVRNPPRPTVALKGKFTLQVRSFPDRDKAEELVEHLRQRGFDAYLNEGELPGKGRWYRVRLGRFASKDLAEKYRQRFVQQEKTEALITLAR